MRVARDQDAALAPPASGMGRCLAPPCVDARRPTCRCALRRRPTIAGPAAYVVGPVRASERWHPRDMLPARAARLAACERSACVQARHGAALEASRGVGKGHDAIQATQAQGVGRRCVRDAARMAVGRARAGQGTVRCGARQNPRRSAALVRRPAGSRGSRYHERRLARGRADAALADRAPGLDCRRHSIHQAPRPARPPSAVRQCRDERAVPRRDMGRAPALAWTRLVRRAAAHPRGAQSRAGMVERRAPLLE